MSVTSPAQPEMARGLLDTSEVVAIERLSSDLLPGEPAPEEPQPQPPTTERAAPWPRRRRRDEHLEVASVAHRVIWLVVFVGVGLGFPGNLPHAAAELPQVRSFDVSPRVADVSAPAPLTLTIRTDGTPTTVTLRAGVGGATLPLSKLSDGVFRAVLPASFWRNGIAERAPGLHPCSALGYCSHHIGFLDYYQGAAKLFTTNVWVLLTDSGIPDVPVTEAAGVRYSPRVASVVVPGAEPGPAMKIAATTAFYGVFPDRYDFLNVVVFPAQHENRTHEVVSNAVQGIGLSVRNGSTLYGSSGRLMGLTNYPIPAIFDLAEAGAVHELGHQWIQFLSLVPELGLGAPHWPPGELARSVMGFNIPGSLAGGFFSFTVTLNGDTARTTFAPPARSFHKLDLYLMGLVPASEVGEFAILDVAGEPCDGCIYDVIRTVTAADVIAAYGPRIPSAQTERRAYTMATIVATNDTHLTDEELALFDFLAARGASKTEVPQRTWYGDDRNALPLYVATGGRAELTMELGTTAPAPAYEMRLPEVTKN